MRITKAEGHRRWRDRHEGSDWIWDNSGYSRNSNGELLTDGGQIIQHLIKAKPSDVPCLDVYLFPDGMLMGVMPMNGGGGGWANDITY